jgi:hypothetical protein
MKIIKTSKVDLMLSARAIKKIDLTKPVKKAVPSTTKNLKSGRFNFELEQKKKILEQAELELARREK